MLGRTHSQAGIISVALTNYLHPVKNIQEGIAIIALGSIASLCCDLDSTNSIPSQLLFGWDEILRKFGVLKHRGLSHFFIRKLSKVNMWIVHFLILFLFISYLTISKDWIISSLVSAYISHLILDDITSFFGIKTGSDFENKFIYNLLGFFAMGGIVSIFYLMF